jgi:hypothetical protein
LRQNAINCETSTATEAYEKAVGVFNAELTKDERKQIKIGTTSNSMSDVRDVLEKAKDSYDSKNTKTTALKWIRKLSKRVMHFGAVLDTLTQHHPEYTSLAWGAMKFILMV